MQSRMDKYNTEFSQVRSRTQKNKALYEDVKNSSLKDFDVNSNVQVIDDGASIIDVGHVREILDSRYNSNAPRRKSIAIPTDFDRNIEEPEEEMDTKEYDINAILSKAKAGKNVDYSKERLKKIRDAQYEILNNLDLELKKIEEPENSKKTQEAEENLMNLISTITHLEAINKEKYSKEVNTAMDLLGLDYDGADEDEEDTTEESTVEAKLKEEINNVNSKEEEPNEEKEIEVIEDKASKDEHIEKTLSKLDINLSSYDDFKDISKSDKSSIVVKIVMFLIIIGLIVGAIYILNNILNLNLF